MTIRFGKIGYLNVLPIYHPLESGIVENDFSIVSGPPSQLNRLMDGDRLDISAASSIEYARHPDKYYLIPDIAIGSRGPVQSVLLLSRFPVEELSQKTILVSSQTHTSAALLHVLQKELWGIETKMISGDATSVLQDGHRPDAILAIGDEALNLRHHPDYSHRIDLGEAWRDFAKLPFIFGVWIVQRNKWDSNRERLENAAQKILEAKKWGIDNLKSICSLAARDSCLSQEEMCSYFDGLVYSFEQNEIKGLELFYNYLEKNGIIKRAPNLQFIP